MSNDARELESQAKETRWTTIWPSADGLSSRLSAVWNTVLTWIPQIAAHGDDHDLNTASSNQRLQRKTVLKSDIAEVKPDEDKRDSDGVDDAFVMIGDASLRERLRGASQAVDSVSHDVYTLLNMSSSTEQDGWEVVNFSNMPSEEEMKQRNYDQAFRKKLLGSLSREQLLDLASEWWQKSAVLANQVKTLLEHEQRTFMSAVVDTQAEETPSESARQEERRHSKQHEQAVEPQQEITLLQQYEESYGDISIFQERIANLDYYYDEDVSARNRRRDRVKSADPSDEETIQLQYRQEDEELDQQYLEQRRALKDDLASTISKTQQLRDQLIQDGINPDEMYAASSSEDESDIPGNVEIELSEAFEEAMQSSNVLLRSKFDIEAVTVESSEDSTVASPAGELDARFDEWLETRHGP